MGGSNDISNLYPESYLIKNGARVKDVLENYLHKQVCNGKLSIIEAQREISTDWLSYYNLYYNKTTTTPVITSPVKTTPTTTIAPVVPDTSPAVKKSSSGLCHAKGTRYYNQTLKYTSYNSIDVCLSSGGKLPK